MKPAIPCRSGAFACLAAIGFIVCCAFSAFAQDETKLLDTETNKGEIVIFHGPDDLHLDPASIVIAVDCFGDDDVDVKGVTFIADKTDDTDVGEAEANGVTVTTTASNQIDAWSATTTFEGADQDSADNLAIVMESIRWEGAPNPITIDVEGLTPGTPYEFQLLFNEGRGPTRYRVWDITVEEELVADNISSIGRLNEDEWDETNSAAYRGVFRSTDTGTLSIVMAQDQGGDPPGGVDNNPILNAIVIHSAVPPGEPALIIEEEVLGNQEFGGALGMDFVVNLPIQVVQLGAFDSESDELALPITVELWSRDDGGTPDIFDDDSGGEILASLMFEEDDGTLEGGTRFSPLESPVVLLPGAYTIVGWGYGAGEPNYNVGGRDAEAEGLTITESDFITFVGGSRFGDAGVNGEWPTSPDGGPENRYGAGNFKFASTGDSDGDGIPDAWEDANGLDSADPADAALDGDDDGLTNLGEFENRTDPNKADTDDDGLKDGVETNTGTFVDATNTGTNPTSSDTDKDDLLDGVETNTGVFVSATDTGTSPLNEDSDDDKKKDGREVANNTDPTDPSDPPPPDPTDIVIGYWPLDEDLKDASGNGGDGELMDGDDDIPDFVEGKLGNALSLDGIGEYVEINPDNEDLYSGHDPDTLEPREEGFSITTWFKVGFFEKSWQALVAKGEGNRWRVHRRGGESIMTGNGGNADVSAGSIAVDDEEWHFLALISNPVDDIVQLYVDGELEGESGAPNVEDNSNPMMIGENPDARGRTWNGLVDDLAFYKRAITEDEMLALWNEGEGASVGEVFLGTGTGPGFRVTNLEYLTGADGAADQVRVTWASRSGATYAVDSSQTIPQGADGWEEAADGVESDGDETSFTVPVPDNATQLYVRIREE